MKIGLVCEGSIDEALIAALLKRIATERVGIHWPVRPFDVFQRINVRRGGHGQIPKAIRRLKIVMGQGPLWDVELFVIVLDHGTRATERSVRREIRGNLRFVLGIAIQEVEAWWLADRRSTLNWLDLSSHEIEDLRYGKRNYNAERDTKPKVTLNELTVQSEAVATRYGDGNFDLASSFAELWQHSADLDQMVVQCPRGFSRFHDSAVAALERSARHRRARP
jgi:hypothetical protein